MKIAIDWVRDYINIDAPAEEIAEKLTASGLEVEGLERVESIKGGLKGVVIGEVKSCEKHPGADKLKLTTVDVGAEELLPIVCGAPNVAAGQKVVVATVGTTLYPEGSEGFKIKKSKIRGEVSMGMICAEDELGLGQSHDGIMVLDTDLPNGTEAAQYFELTDKEVIEIGLTPNRVDGASHYGVARDLKVLYGAELHLPKINIDLNFDQGDKFEIDVQDTVACPRYAGITISNLKVGPSPAWLAERLESIGLAPINNVVDCTNYVLHALGQPLHAFDLEKVNGKVVVKRAAEGEKFVTLDEQERTLNANDLMICNESESMCMAGVFGGIESGVSDATTSIFLESAYFAPDVIRKTASTHSLKTDASFRFERGTDPNMVIFALKYAASLIIEVAGGEITSAINDIYPQPIQAFEVDVQLSRISSLIGVDIAKERILEIFKGLEIEIVDDNGDALKLAVPPYRVDVQREADIVEEVLRIIGFESVPLSENLSTNFLAQFPQKDVDSITYDMKEMLAAKGYSEIMTNSLTNPAYYEENESFALENCVHIENPLTAELAVMRQTLLYNGLEVIKHNINRKQFNLKLFEFGKVYAKYNDQYVEGSRWVMFLTGNASEESWQEQSTNSSYFELAQQVQSVLMKLGAVELSQEVFNDNIFSGGAQLKFRKKKVAKVGKLQKSLLKKMGVSQEVFYAEIQVDILMEMLHGKLQFEPLSKYPSVRRDLSVVLDNNVTFEQLRQVALKSAKPMLTSVNVFDTYAGDKLEDGKKSYSVSFILEDKTKTLTDKVIDKTMQRLIANFEKQLGAIIRN